MIRILAALLGLAALNACTLTEVYANGERQSRSLTIGAVYTPEPAENGTHTVLTRGLGVRAGSSGVTLGYFSTQATYVAHDCFALFIVPDAAEAARLIARLHADTICVAVGD